MTGAFGRFFEGLEPEEPVTTSDVFRALLDAKYQANPPRVIDDPLVDETYRLGVAKPPRPDGDKGNPFRRVSRYGYLWFSGTTEQHGEQVQYLFPAISFVMTVTLEGDSVLAAIRTTKPRVTELISDIGCRRELLERAVSSSWIKKLQPKSVPKTLSPKDWAKHPDLGQWVADVAAAIGLTITEVRNDSPVLHKDKLGISVHIGAANYQAGAVPKGKQFYSLDDVDVLPSFRGTAFSGLYGRGELNTSGQRQLAAFRPLSHRQRRIASRVAGNDIAVISGAPGTGKSHVLSVVAADAIARGESVLVVVSTPQAVDVLVEHFSKTPGPPPITFGGSVHGKRINRELIDLSLMISDDEDTDEELEAQARAHDVSVRALRRYVFGGIEAERFEEDDDYRQRATAALARAGDLDEVEELIAKVRNAGLALARSSLKDRLGDLDDMEGDLEQLLLYKETVEILDKPSFTLAHRFDELFENEIEAARIGGEVLTDHWISRLSKRDEQTLVRLAEIVIANPEERKVEFTKLDPKRLAKAAPLWLGALGDVDNVLPPVAGMFDLVIMDEAAHVDQIQAAHVLIRAKRALFFGDREQITHVSSLTDEMVEDVATQHRLAVTSFNPKNWSVFDVAAARVPSEALDEHFRSAPHLIEFSSRRFYQGGLHTVTRNPVNEAADHISLQLVDGVRENGVNPIEVEACLSLVERYENEGWTSIGVVSPLREHIEEVRAAAARRWFSDDHEHRGVRIGTPAEFQGDERDVMIISYGVGRDEPDAAWDGVNDANFFNVMVTRAREHAVIVTSNPAPPGLAGEYVLWSEPLVDLVADAEISDPWVHQVAEALNGEGISTRIGYKAGRHIIDIVAGSPENAVAIDCGFHENGPEAHIDRALTLRRTGWRTADAFELKWRYLLSEFVEDLRERFPDLT